MAGLSPGPGEGTRSGQQGEVSPAWSWSSPPRSRYMW